VKNFRPTLFAVKALLVAMVVLGIATNAVGQQRESSSTPSVQLLQPDIRHDWIPLGGSWKENGGIIENESEERGAKLMFGLKSWHDYFVEADVELLGSSGDAGLIIRASGEEEGVDSYHGYFAGIRDKDDVALLGRADFGWDQYAAVPLVSAVEVGRWYHLTLVSFECNIAFSVADEQNHITRIFAIDSQCLQSGRIGLKSYGSGARWKNIKVGPSDQNMVTTVSNSETPVVIGAERSPFAMGFTDKALERYMGPIQREARKQHLNHDIRSIDSLKLLDPESQTPTSIHGVVTITRPTIYVQDSTGSIAVEAAATSVPVKIGDEVEARGWVVLPNYIPVLKQASFHILWPNVPLSPLAVSAFELASGGHNGNLVELPGTFVSRSVRQNGTTQLTLSDDTQQFYVIAESSIIDTQLRSVPLGSRLLVRGVVTYNPDLTMTVVPFALLLPSSASLVVIALPSWWTPLHISMVATFALLLILAFQLLLIRIQRWRLRAVLKERERLALDMHDTLTQSFAGIGFQLQAVRDETPLPEPSRRHVEVAIAMVHSSHEEAKRNISALRPEYLGKSDLIEALCEYANRIIDGRSIHVSSCTKGRTVNIPLYIADAMFRIGEEAISNAIRHAKPSSILISLVFEGHTVGLTLGDDGCGFTNDRNQVGLGIRGMEKRAWDIGALLEISSSVGDGTSVRIVVTINPHRTISQRLETVLDFVAGA
jgi:signal transduction histidine kinase